MMKPNRQNCLDTWMEFQNYHLERLEQFEKRRNELKRTFDDCHDINIWSDTAGLTWEVEDSQDVQQGLKCIECKLARHIVLLQWIEQERRAMDSGHEPPVKRDGDHQAEALNVVRRASARTHQNRQPKASAFHGLVSNLMPKKRNWQDPEFAGRGPRRAIQISSAALENNIPRISQRRKTKPQQAMPGSASHGHKPVPHVIRTRSGRVSKPPVRWAPR
jgi:hypothetical protein